MQLHLMALFPQGKDQSSLMLPYICILLALFIESKCRMWLRLDALIKTRTLFIPPFPLLIYRTYPP